MSALFGVAAGAIGVACYFLGKQLGSVTLRPVYATPRMEPEEVAATRRLASATRRLTVEEIKDLTSSEMVTVRMPSRPESDFFVVSIDAGGGRRAYRRKPAREPGGNAGVWPVFDGRWSFDRDDAHRFDRATAKKQATAFQGTIESDEEPVGYIHTIFEA